MDLAVPPGLSALPAFDRGWVLGDDRLPFLAYAEADSANWSEGLEALHEESSRTHFLDVWTRDAVISRLGELPHAATVVDLGCSSGYLLHDLHRAHPDSTLVGVDLIASGLQRAHVLVPDARLVQADACALPLADASVDAVVSANLLEHVPDDRRALREIGRILRPGARAVVVVPAGSGLYDYYDRFLGHERRYARGELARKAAGAGLEALEVSYLGSLLYLPFWLVKKRNRLRYGHLEGDRLESRVERDIAATRDSAVGRVACRIERRLLDGGPRLPLGIRCLAVLRGP
jgi:SAM-dependent methyltransferase